MRRRTGFITVVLITNLFCSRRIFIKCNFHIFGAIIESCHTRKNLPSARRPAPSLCLRFLPHVQFVSRYSSPDIGKLFRESVCLANSVSAKRKQRLGAGRRALGKFFLVWHDSHNSLTDRTQLMPGSALYSLKFIFIH